MLSHLGSMTNFENFHFLVPPPRGVGVKNSNSKFAQNLVFQYLGKAKKFKMKISLC